MTLFEQVTELAAHLPRDPRQPRLPLGIDEKEIEAFENRTGLSVPQVLRQWLKYTNSPGIGSGGVNGILTPELSRDIEAYYDIFPNWKNRGWIPIGGDGCGNYYVMATRPEDGPGMPVFFVEPIWDRDSPRYVVASELLHFLRFYFRKDLGKRGWPCNRELVLAEDPDLSYYSRIPKCWEIDSGD